MESQDTIICAYLGNDIFFDITGYNLYHVKKNKFFKLISAPINPLSKLCFSVSAEPYD